MDGRGAATGLGDGARRTRPRGTRNVCSAVDGARPRWPDAGGYRDPRGLDLAPAAVAPVPEKLNGLLERLAREAAGAD